MERVLVPRAGYPFSTVRVRGFTRSLGWHTLRSAASLPVAGVDAWRLVRTLRPACTVGVGAYASGPVVAVAALLGMPTLAIEMDAHMGWTNRLLSRLVDRVCLSLPGAHGDGGKFVYTGRPIRPGLLAATREEGRARFGLADDLTVVLVFGGSLGARTLNDATLAAFAAEPTPFAVLHVTGERDYARVRAAVDAGGNPRYQAFPFLDDFGLALAACDIAVARAGGSVAELLARGVPSVLVPWPAAAGDHQTANAQAVAAAGAAVMVPDGECTGPRLTAEVTRMLAPGVRERMGVAALALARPDAAFRVADEIVQLAGPPRAPR
jgi:UDP-N-acetylglucosamine--N-acetylmuramyl-(pentapeptide) pyrophosphoryl-undecaprenol N-acetylglucosamine transferase